MYHFQFSLIHFLSCHKQHIRAVSNGMKGSFPQQHPLRGQATSRACRQRGCPGLRRRPELTHRLGGDGERTVTAVSVASFGHKRRRRGPYTHRPPGLPTPAASLGAAASLFAHPSQPQALRPPVSSKSMMGLKQKEIRA